MQPGTSAEHALGGVCETKNVAHMRPGNVDAAWHALQARDLDYQLLLFLP
jgi:hypothetical protein